MVAKRKQSSTPTKRLGKLPDAPRGQHVNRNYAALAEESFGAEGYAGKSLLRSVVGRIRIPAPRNSLLAALVQQRQSVYAAILGRIMSGASLVSAAVAVGVNRNTVRDWLVQGLTDQANDSDTYYSRFASDIHAALAHSVGEAELAVMRRNPIEYLRSGPGRAFYQDREQYWQQQDPRMPAPESDINPMTELPAGDADAIPSDRASLALDALKELGILNDPQFALQLREQSGQQQLVDEGTVVDAMSPVVVNGRSVVVDGPSSVQPSPTSVAPDRAGMDRSSLNANVEENRSPPARTG